MIRYYVMAALAFLLLTGAFWAQHNVNVALREQAAVYAKQYKDLNESYVALSARTDAIQVLTAQQAKEAQENRNALQKAIRSLPDGGARGTPAVIVDRLCKSLNCAKAVVPLQPVPAAKR